MAAWTPRALIDFDGVIHRYSLGWSDGTAYDGPMDGALHGLARLSAMGYEVVIFSTRDGDQIRTWLAEHGAPAYRVTSVKEPALFQLDDRAIRFEDWDQALNDVRQLYPLVDTP